MGKRRGCWGWGRRGARARGSGLGHSQSDRWREPRHSCQEWRLGYVLIKNGPHLSDGLSRPAVWTEKEYAVVPVPESIDEFAEAEVVREQDSAVADCVREDSVIVCSGEPRVRSHDHVAPMLS